ncbi:hypothetical protein BJY00DRAFT_28582 [Aspergillus carlsbadensis]|nr:hypothetical protein BJY00DRAFT_28582 [Aspergillus carlsbadensis]
MAVFRLDYDLAVTLLAEGRRNSPSGGTCLSITLRVCVKPRVSLTHTKREMEKNMQVPVQRRAAQKVHPYATPDPPLAPFRQSWEDPLLETSFASHRAALAAAFKPLNGQPGYQRCRIRLQFSSSSGNQLFLHLIKAMGSRQTGPPLWKYIPGP